MEHVEFIDSLNISVRKYPPFKLDKAIVGDKYYEYERGQEISSKQYKRLITHCIDMDTWKHSWHISVDDDANTEKIKSIIQEKIKDRDNELRVLFEAYFRLIEKQTKQP